MTLEGIGSAEIDEVIDFKRLLDGVDDDLFHFGELIVDVVVFRNISFEFIRIEIEGFARNWIDRKPAFQITRDSICEEIV